MPPHARHSRKRSQAPASVPPESQRRAKDAQGSSAHGPPQDHPPSVPPSPPSQAPAEPWFVIAAAAALLLLTVAAYVPTLRAGYIWDDEAVSENPLLRSPAGPGLKTIWTRPSAMRQVESHYWPLVYTSFWLEYRLYGPNPQRHHLINVLLHAINAVLLWLILRRIALPGAWLAAALFALHPVHVESVAWIIERKDVLSGLFYFSAALAYLHFFDRRSKIAYAAALVLYACAMLSKSITISFPIALLLWRWWKTGRLAKREVLPILPFFGVAAVLGAVDVFTTSQIVPVALKLTLFDRVLIAGRALWFYAAKLIWPVDLMALYPKWPAQSPLSVALFLGVFGILIALWSLRRRVGRGPLAAVLFFCVTLGPVLGFIRYSFMTRAYVADRFQYLASAGLLALVAAGAVAAARRLGPVINRIALPAAAALVLAALGILTWRQAATYRDLESFWGYNYSKHPEQTAASSYGDTFIRRAQRERNMDQRRQLLDRAEELELESIAAGETPRARFRLGEVFLERRQYDKALEQFLRSREINSGPNRVDSIEAALCVNIGSCYWSKGDLAKCKEYWELALKVNPNLREPREWLPKLEQRLRTQNPYPKPVPRSPSSPPAS